MAYVPVNPYISIAELVEELDGVLPTVGSAKEDKFLRSIDLASRWVDNYLSQDFFDHVHTVVPIVLDQFSRGVYDDKIFLPFKPVRSIVSISAGSTFYIANTDYHLHSEIGVLYSLRGNWLPYRPDSLITIYGTFGYLQAVSSDVPIGIPGHIKLATRMVAAVIAGEARKEMFGVDGSVNQITMTEIPKMVFQMLGRQMPILI